MEDLTIPDTARSGGTDGNMTARSGAGGEESNGPALFTDEVLSDKQKMRIKLETDREGMKEVLKAMSPGELFALFDDDDSGLVDFEEFKRLLPYLEIYISDLKAYRYFRICDTSNDGEIDVDEFKVALFICDPTSGNPVGFAPSRLLTPTDAFETFNEAQDGFMDEDELFYAMEYMQLDPTDHKHEQLFQQFDSNHTGSIDYFEFREIFLLLCDVRRELEERGVDVPTFTRRNTLVLILRGLLDDEERRERQAIAEAKRYKKWIMAVREKKKVLQKASFRAYQELRNALDAAGHVYVFGGGGFKQFDAIPHNKMKTGKFTFQLFDRVLELWKDRVKPEQLVDRLKNIRKVEEDDAKRDMERGEDGMGALGAVEEGKKVIIDPYKEALISGFLGLNVSLNTASLWGRRVHHVAVTESVVFALADTGEIFTWGGNSYWWHEIQPDSLYQTKWRGDTTARSQLLLGTVDKVLPPDASLDNVISGEEMTPEEKFAEQIKVVTKYYDCWEPPPNPATRMIYLTKDLLPKVQYDEVKFSLKARGKDLGERTKLELIEELYEDILMEKKLLGERAHKAIRELETQVADLLKRKKDKLANKFMKRIDEMWLPLREVQAEQRAAELAKKLAAEHHSALKVETDYQYYRKRLLEKRESLDPEMTARGNSIKIDLSGMTPRGPGLETPRGFQSAIQIASGTAHACLVHKSGQLYSWGMGAAGRLGLDLTEDGDPQKDVVQVQALAGRPVLRVACGYSHTGCIVAGGELYMWGSAGTGKCGLGEITDTVECYCSIPTRVLVGGEDKRVRKISCGSAHSGVVTESGQVYVFGCGDGGRLGMGKNIYETVFVPVLVEGLENFKISNISCGNSTTFLTTEVKYSWAGKEGGRYRTMQGGKVFMAGSQNVLGRQCDSFTPLRIPGNASIKLVSAGYQHTALVSGEGELFTFGFNRNTCCGVMPGVHFVPEPTIVSCLYSNAHNLALNKAATQCSIYDSRDGKYAVDGDKDGHGPGKCAMTQQESQPWIEVDLGKMAVIEEIRLWNRTDVPKDRHLAKDMYTNKLFPCWILVGRDPFSTVTNQVGFKDNLRNAVSKVKFTENQRMSSWHPPANTQGRYIRVQLEAFESLCISEIEVFGNFGLNKGVGRVSYAAAGRDMTVAVIRAATDSRDVESAYRRAAYADAGNADILRQLETFALEYDKFGRGEVLQKTCDICKGDVRCEACDLFEVYAEEIEKIPPGIGGRRRRLKSVDEFLIHLNKPDLEYKEIPRKTRPTKAEKRKDRWRSFLSSWGLVKHGPSIIRPEEALEIDPENALERVVLEHEASAHAEGKDALMDSAKLLDQVSHQPGANSKSKSPNPNGKSRRASTLGKKDTSTSQDDSSISSSVGTNMLKDKDKSRKSKKGKKGTSENENKIPQVGDVLLTGQVVRGAVPKSIAIPAAESEASVQAEIEKKKNKKEIEAGIAARDSALKKKGDIS